MYVSPWFQAALLPRRWDVAGFTCPSLTVWQLFALEQLGNKYMVGGEPTLDDAAGLIVVVTSSRKELRQLVISPNRFAKKLSSITKKLLPVPFEQLDRAASDYVMSCTRTPDHKRITSSSGSPAAAPYQWHIVLCLCDHYGLTPDAAWEMPYAEARCMFDTWAEAQGSKTLADAKLQQSIDDWVISKETANG